MMGHEILLELEDTWTHETLVAAIEHRADLNEAMARDVGVDLAGPAGKLIAHIVSGVQTSLEDRNRMQLVLELIGWIAAVARHNENLRLVITKPGDET